MRGGLVDLFLEEPQVRAAEGGPQGGWVWGVWHASEADSPPHTPTALRAEPPQGGSFSVTKQPLMLPKRRAWRSAAALVLSVLGFAAPARAQPTPAAPAADESTELIVRLRPDAPRATLRAFSDRRIGTLRAVRDAPRDIDAILTVELPRTYLLRAADPAAAARLAADLAREPGVAYAVPNRLRRLDGLAASPPAPKPMSLRRVDQALWAPPALRALAAAPFDSLRNYVLTGVDAAHRITRGSPSVRIGIVDTGLDFDHPAFAGQIAINAGEDIDRDGRFTAADLNGIDDDGNGYVDDVAGYDFVDRPASVSAGDVRQRDGDPREDDVPGGGRGHGTYVAGIVAARETGAMVGVAPGARLVVLRAFAADGLGQDDDIAAAIAYAIRTRSVEVLNLSFGDVYESPLVRDIVEAARAAGIVVVASAGNDGTDAPHFPSDYPGVIAAQWLDETGTQPGFLASYGTGIDVGAPATLVYTTRMPSKGDTGSTPRLYARVSGSSVAAPLVAGAAALLLSLDPGLTPDAVRSILTNTTDDIGEPGWDHRTGAGRIRIDRALLRSLPGRVEIVSPRADGGVNGTAAILGSALDPAFVSFRVEAARGDSGAFVWQAIGAERTIPVSRDTLAVWPTDGLAEGVYTLRAVVRRSDGRTAEARQRVRVDRSPPVFRVLRAQSGLSNGAPALLLDIETDDPVTVAASAPSALGMARGASDRLARVHGITLPLSGGVSVAATVTATNAAGLQATATVSATPPAESRLAGAFRERPTSIPDGTLLARATDFDGDGLPEIVLNRSGPGGNVSDSVLVMEWNGRDFATVHRILGPLLPRDAGDVNGNGRGDLLLTSGGVTLLVEASVPGGYPDRVVFADTSALSGETSSRAFYGGRLTDLDGDGRGEIAGHNTRQWRLVESTGGSGFALLDTLRNPTLPSGDLSRNEQSDAVTAYGDFDGNGRPELVTLDADGDIIAYEVENGRGVARWTLTTTRYGFRPRFASGRFAPPVGGGAPRMGLVVATTSWPTVLSNREVEPPRTILYRVDFSGSAPVLADSIGIDRDAQRSLSLAALDVDGDGADELAVAIAPDLYLLSVGTDGRWRLRDVRTETTPTVPNGTRAAALVVHDLDGDGVPDLLVPLADGRTRRLIPARAAPLPAPAVASATLRAVQGAMRLVVRLSAPGADSVSVYGADPAEIALGRGGFDILGTVRADSLALTVPRDLPRLPTAFFAAAWTNGRRSEASAVRTFVFDAPVAGQGAVAIPITNLADPRAGYIEVVFGGPIAPPPPGSVRVNGRVADVNGGVDLDPVPTGFLVRDPGGAVVVAWTGLRTRGGAAISDGEAVVQRTLAREQYLRLVSARVEDRQRVRLVFSAPLDTSAANAARYHVTPQGEIASVSVDAGNRAEVVVTIRGASVGANGLAAGLYARGLRSADGRRLDPDGAAVQLSRAASDLAGLTAFPNPARPAESPDGVMIAGLPPVAELVILSPEGRMIRRLDETDGDGGVRWDLKDESGADVPSGVYLVRVRANGRLATVRVAVLR